MPAEQDALECLDRLRIAYEDDDWPLTDCRNLVEDAIAALPALRAAIEERDEHGSMLLEFVRLGMKNVIPSDLPKWHSHKVVQAAKIVRVDESVPCLVIRVDGQERGLLPRTSEFWKRREPFRGLKAPDHGYYVLYEDGFESWSPTKAFEGGYAKETPTEEGE